MIKIIPGDCLTVLPTLADNSIDAIVTDPPYGLSNTDPGHVIKALTHWLAGDRAFVPHVGGGGFMGKDWDKFVPPPAAWDECLRVLKPGGHLLSFAGTRTIGLMEITIRLAGFEIRDSIAWLYGSGFPKSLDVGKAIDKAVGAEREVVGNTSQFSGRTVGRGNSARGGYEGGEIVSGHCRDITAPATPEAAQWQGWGTALKPAFEPIIVARKPFPGTVAANVLEHGTGALNVNGCRIGERGASRKIPTEVRDKSVTAYGNGLNGGGGERDLPFGRWPANVILDSDAAAELGEPSRFFYCAKASKQERPVVNGMSHPTVKPLALMRWLVRLATAPGGTVLDPFTGSGATVEAAILEGFDVIGIERESAYLPMIDLRIERSA
jgi:hypothetical protein